MYGIQNRQNTKERKVQIKGILKRKSHHLNANKELAMPTEQFLIVTCQHKARKITTTLTKLTIEFPSLKLLYKKGS